ncbi:hypothetical protein GTW37_12715, partial [Streptomyces sp. SID4931]|nr:hypothetical protein [Streptomyces sp. SID4931]
MSAPGNGRLVPFLLPGSPPMRDTASGWEHWRTTRNNFVPAPRLSLAEWRRLSSRKRSLHDLHRAATHANLPLLQTPMTKSVTKLLHGRIMTNALKRKPTTRAGVMVTGGGYQGKTETICEIAATFEDSWCKAILNFYGAPLNPRMDLPDLIRQVATSLHDHGTKALILDDITRLRLHR